ncbi:MAG: type II toxin-antitoxin system PemK/MazF family toxin [Bilifractor sp.]
MWWVQFPFEETNDSKHRPAIVIDDHTLAVLAMYVTSKSKEWPYSIEIQDWKEAGLHKKSWTRIDRTIEIEAVAIDEKIGKLTDRDLQKIMQLYVEILTNTRHEFTLLAIKDTVDRFLLRYDERWKCWLFPYTRSKDNNKENADRFASAILDRNICTEYKAEGTHCKYSQSDEVYKIYHHKLYQFILEEIPQNMQDNEFELYGSRYKWMTITQMQADPEIMRVNADIVGFVKIYC